MNTDYFWQLIDDARRNTTNVNDTADALVTRLTSMSVRNIMRWHHICNTYIALSYTRELWDVADDIVGRCSDDGFDYFRGGLLAQGRDVFVEAINAPERLKSMNINLGPHQGEEMLTAGWEAFALKAGLNLGGDITQAGEFERIQRHLDIIEAVSEKHRLSRDEERELAMDIRGY